MQLGDVFHDGEPKPRPPELPGPGLIDAVEAIENAKEILLGDSDTGELPPGCGRHFAAGPPLRRARDATDQDEGYPKSRAVDGRPDAISLPYPTRLAQVPDGAPIRRSRSA